jgi:FtsH-binding integral membrane protein
LEKKDTLTSAFTWLFIGLLICFGISWITTFNEDLAFTIFGALNGYAYLVYLIAEIVIALILIIRINKLKPTTAKILYIAYTALTGLSLTGIFVVYTASSLTFVFLAAAIIFGVFALIGKTTNIDLSKWGIYVLIALIAIIILEIINIFLMNNSLNMILCIASILVFSFFIAFDIQKALDKSYMAECENKGIYCAFQLFLDFINIFIDLLRLFGKRSD